MNTFVKAFALATTTLVMNTAVLAVEGEDVSPSEGGDSRMIYLSVDKMPTVSLSGSVFEQPTMPSMDSLASMQTTELGEMYIKSSAGQCHLSVTTEYNFALMNLPRIDSTEGTMDAVLAEYKLAFATGDNTQRAEFSAMNPGEPVSIACQSATGMSTGGLLSFIPVTYDENAPAGVYRDIVHVQVEAAG